MSHSLLHIAYVNAASRERLEGHDGRPRPQPPPPRVRPLAARVLALAAERLSSEAAREVLAESEAELPAPLGLRRAPRVAARSCEGRHLAALTPVSSGGRQGRRR